MNNSSKFTIAVTVFIVLFGVISLTSCSMLIPKIQFPTVEDVLGKVDFSEFLDEIGEDADIGDLSDYLNGLGINGSNLNLSDLLKQITSGDYSGLISGDSGLPGDGEADWSEIYSATGLPNPEGIFRADRYYQSGESTVVEINGMSYAQFVSYCKSLENISGWEKVSGSAGLPDTAPEKGKAVMSGYYGSYSEVRATFNSLALCDSTGCSGVVIELFD